MKLRKKRCIAILLFLLGICFIASSIAYTILSSPMDRKDNQEIEVIIPNGMTNINVGKVLASKGLIRNTMFFRIFLRLNQAGTIKADVYQLKKSMSMNEIVTILTEGTHSNPNAIMVTFPEGKNMKEYGAILEKNTKIKSTDFLSKMQDRTYISNLISKYWFLTDAILNENIYYPLEGYLAPDTYQFNDENVTIEEVVLTLLDETENRLKDFKTTLETQQNIHDIFTLASIAQLEGIHSEDRKMIVGVFQNRLRSGMNLGSDVTTYYAFQEDMTQDLTLDMFNTYNPYNTRSSQMAGRLPVGPICNPDITSIEAAIAPTENDYYYFVADKNGKVYYTKTAIEHAQMVQTIKDRGDWIW